MTKPADKRAAEMVRLVEILCNKSLTDGERYEQGLALIEQARRVLRSVEQDGLAQAREALQRKVRALPDRGGIA